MLLLQDWTRKTVTRVLQKLCGLVVEEGEEDEHQLWSVLYPNWVLKLCNADTNSKDVIIETAVKPEDIKDDCDSGNYEIGYEPEEIEADDISGSECSKPVLKPKRERKTFKLKRTVEEKQYCDARPDSEASEASPELNKELNRPRKFKNENRVVKKKEPSYSCDVCGKMYTSESILKIHRLMHGKATFSCKHCGKAFKSPYDLKYHEARHENGPVACNICGKLFAGKKDVRQHELNVHSEQNMVDCHICGKALKGKSYLSKHISDIHHDNLKKFCCDLCPTIVRTRSKLLKHIQVVHEKSHQFPCPYCGTILSHKDKFNRHSLSRHGGIKLPSEEDLRLKSLNSHNKMAF